MYLLYSLAILLFVGLASPYFLYQAVRRGKYVANLRQRTGRLPVSFNLDGDESIWIHAVSVGEVLAARALLPDLRERYPHLRLFVSTTTVTGQQVARQHLHDLDGVFYFPFDLPFVVRRTLRVVRPRLLVMVETEIWPNLLRACRQQGVATVLVNGRISSQSWSRYRLARPFFRRVLRNVDRCCMQSEESARRLIDIGAERARVSVTGSLKFDSLEVPATLHARGRDRVLRFFRLPADRLVVIAASTLKGEEPPVLRAFARVKEGDPRALLIVAPRRPERFQEVEHLARREGFRVVRRTDLRVDAEPRADIVVLDTIGELAPLYHVATVVFVGGSLVEAGGHNILEPAVFGKAILFGPHMQNFAEIARTFVAHGAAWQVPSPREFEAALLTLVQDPVRRAAMGAAARALVEANRGAKDRTLAVIAEVLPDSRRGVVRPFRVV